MWARDLALAHEWFSREAHPEALDETRDTRGVHLQLVAIAEAAEIGGLGLCDSAEFDELSEETFEAGGRDDLEDPAWIFPRVPERVPFAAGLEDEVAGARLEHVPAEDRSHAAFEHVAVLVFSQVAVERRGECVRRHRMLDERKTLGGRLAADHEPYANAAEEPRVALCRPQIRVEVVCMSAFI